MKTFTALLLLLPAAVTAAVAPVESPLAPLAFLAGHCWVTRFGNGREIDTHCYEWMHGGQQLRDRHVVKGDKPDYLGETIYAYNAERKRVEYRYWNSLGGLSDGYFELAPDGRLQFLDDRYVGPDGVPYVFSSEMTQPGEALYQIVSRYRDGDDWKEMWTRLFERQQPSAAPPP